ncbi:MAG TPA: glycosyltransferase family A protein [Candidatus Sulfotelmatobacter sp.]|jgi:glycosyltransferase involved in cell wall biosynthesis|nr:glycosyltransferase family A protein [Candidatus Sulfotelmatobacter sp.]
MPTFSVITPTFNRAHTLPRVWESLRAQTYPSFEWVVVDDGSTDGTGALVAGWAAHAPFPVRYLRQENRGKHVAVNRGVSASSGEMIVVLDSDDACVPSALERFAFHWRSIPEQRRGEFYAIVCNCVDPEGRLVGDPFPAAVIDARGLDVRYVWRVRGEKWGTVRAELLRETPFPEKPERMRMPESIVWDRLAQKYSARFVNEALRVYYLEPGEGSLGSPGDPARYAWGSMLQHRIVLDEHLDYFRAAPLAFLTAAAHYVRFSRHAGVAGRDQRRALSHRGARFLWWMAAPAGWAAWAIDRSRRWISS